MAESQVLGIFFHQLSDGQYLLSIWPAWLGFALIVVAGILGIICANYLVQYFFLRKKTQSNFPVLVGGEKKYIRRISL